MSPRGPRKRLARGVYEDRAGIEARVQVKGLSDRAYWPKSGPRPSREDIRRWQDKARALLRRKVRAGPAGPFVDDVARYLTAVSSMPTYAERALHLREWSEAFGPRRRDSLSAAEIRAQLELWKTDRGLSASALNHRRTALQHLFSVLDGKSGENPVRDVPRYKEPDALPRGLPWPTIRSILKAMPPGVDRLRCALIAWTGLPHAQLSAIRREQIDLTHRTLARPGRRKGAGTKAQLIPLTRRACWFFRLLERANGFGAFDRWHLRRAFQKGCAAVGVEGVRVYDLRHSFGSLVYQQTHDLQATAVLMGHASLVTTRRYTLAAVPAALSAAIAKIEAKPQENVSPARDPDTIARLLTFSQSKTCARSSGG